MLYGVLSRKINTNFFGKYVIVTTEVLFLCSKIRPTYERIDLYQSDISTASRIPIVDTVQNYRIRFS
jgi:hypothetical protein